MTTSRSDRVSRRGFLLGSVSLGALAARGPAWSAFQSSGHDPALEAVGSAVRALSGLLRPSLVGVDLADLRAVLGGGGVAVYALKSFWGYFLMVIR